MEPDPAGLEGLAHILGMVLGAAGLLADPGPLDILTDAAPDHRPLRLSVPGRLYDIHPSQIRSAARVDGFGGPALDISFDAEVSSWIAVSTELFVGQPMHVYLCEEEVMAPVIREPVHGGTIRISGDFDADQLDAMLLLISGRVACDGTPLQDPVQPKRRGG